MDVGVIHTHRKNPLTAQYIRVLGSVCTLNDHCPVSTVKEGKTKREKSITTDGKSNDVISDVMLPCSHLESQVELLQRTSHFRDEHVHALSLLECHHDVGGSFLGRDLRHDLGHVEVVWQLL